MKSTLFVLFLSMSIQALAQSQFKNLKVLPPDIENRELRSLMNDWSNALGFRCDSCHFTQTGKFDDIEFEVDTKPTKQAAREMFQMMTRLNETFFAQRQTKVSCYTCHHGTSDPRSLDEILSASLQEGGVEQVADTYRELREKYHGLGAYNFGPWTGLNSLAARLVGEKKYGQAKVLHELNLEHNPDYDGSHFALGAHYIVVEPDEDKARHHMQRAMEGNAFWTPRRLLRVAASLQRDQPPAATLALKILTEVAPDNAEGHYQLGRALASNGDTAGARSAYRTALQKDPEHKDAAAALAEQN